MQKTSQFFVDGLSSDHLHLPGKHVQDFLTSESEGGRQVGPLASQTAAWASVGVWDMGSPLTSNPSS
jgi:hypothetical protein